MESLRPFLAAVVAAPILKLWPENLVASMPAVVSAYLKQVTNVLQVRGAPD